MLVERAQIILDPRRRLHLAAGVGQPFLLARLDPQRIDLANREIEPFAIAIRLGERLPSFGQLGLERASLCPRRFDRARIELAERVEQGAVALGVEQAAIVVLAVNFDRRPGNVAQQRGRNRGAPSKGAAAAIGLERSPEQQGLARIALDPLFAKRGKGGVAARKVDLGADAGRRLARTDQPGIGAQP